MNLRKHDKFTVKGSSYNKYPHLGCDVTHTGIVINVTGDECKVALNGNVYTVDVVDIMVSRNRDEESASLLNSLGYYWGGCEWVKR